MATTTTAPTTQPPGFQPSASPSSTLQTSSSTNSPTLFSNSSAKPYGYTSPAQAISSVTALLGAHAALLHRVRQVQEVHRESLRQLRGQLPSPELDELLSLPLVPSTTIDNDVYGEYEHDSDVYYGSEEEEDTYTDQEEEQKRRNRPDLPPAKRARLQRYRNYVPEEETIRNDYSQRYVDGGEWPQNWVVGAEPERRFEEYPKQQRLLQLKKASVNEYSLPPTYLTLTLPSTPKSSLSQRINASLVSMHPSKFDVILIDPPYHSSSSSSSNSGFTWDNLQDLPIPTLAAEPSFVFLWVGSGAGEGLERGREILAKWGYRRCEDVVWVRTNKDKYREGCGGPGTDPPTTSLLTRTKQHCLMGIRGTVRRSTDSWFVHCNVDTDVIIWEGDPLDPTRKPPEMYTLIENFCLGLRRLEVFGKLSSLRRGWVTALGPGQEDLLPKNKDGGDLEENGRIYIEGGENALLSSGNMSSSFGAGAGTGSSSASSSGEGEAETQGKARQESPMDVDNSITATRWKQDTWEEGIRELAASSAASAIAAGFNPNGNANVSAGPSGTGTVKPVVPMSAEIDALRPKSPVRPGQGGGGGGNNSGSNNSGGGGGGGYGGNSHSHNQQYHGGGGGGSGRGNLNMNLNNASTMAQPMSMSMGMGMGNMGPPILRFGGSSTVVVPSGGSGAGAGGGARGGGGGGVRGGGGGGGNVNMNLGMGMGMANAHGHNNVMSMGAGGMLNMGMGMGMNVNPDMGLGVGMNAMNAMNGMGSGMGVGGMNSMGMSNMGMGIPSMGNMGMNMVNGGAAGMGVGGSNMLMAQPVGSGALGAAGLNAGVGGMDDMGWNPLMGTNSGAIGMGMGGMGVGGMNQQQHRSGMSMNAHNNMANLNNNNMHLGMGNMNALNGMNMNMNGMNMNMNPGMMNMSLGVGGAGGGIPNLQHMGMGMGMGLMGPFGGVSNPTGNANANNNNNASGHGMGMHQHAQSWNGSGQF